MILSHTVPDTPHPHEAVSSLCTPRPPRPPPQFGSSQLFVCGLLSARQCAGSADNGAAVRRRPRLAPLRVSALCRSSSAEGARGSDPPGFGNTRQQVPSEERAETRGVTAGRGCAWSARSRCTPDVSEPFLQVLFPRTRSSALVPLTPAQLEAGGSAQIIGSEMMFTEPPQRMRRLPQLLVPFGQAWFHTDT